VSPTLLHRLAATLLDEVLFDAVAHLQGAAIAPGVPPVERPAAQKQAGFRPFPGHLDGAGEPAGTGLQPGIEHRAFLDAFLADFNGGLAGAEAGGLVVQPHIIAAEDVPRIDGRGAQIERAAALHHKFPFRGHPGRDQELEGDGQQNELPFHDVVPLGSLFFLK